MILYACKHFNNVSINHPLILDVKLSSTCHYYASSEIQSLCYYFLPPLLNYYLSIHIILSDLYYFFMYIPILTATQISDNYFIESIFYSLPECVLNTSTTPCDNLFHIREFITNVNSSFLWDKDAALAGKLSEKWGIIPALRWTGKQDSSERLAGTWVQRFKGDWKRI